MPQSRREFLRSGGQASLALGLSACGLPEGADSGMEAESSPSRGSEPAAWIAPGKEDQVSFPSGLQLGDVESTRVQFSVLTAQLSVRLVLMVADGEQWVLEREEAGLLSEDGRLGLEFEDLEADRAYSLVVYAEDGKGRSAVARFRTALGRDCDRIVVFGATSCFKHNQPWPGLSLAAQEALDFFVLLGDTIYASSSTLEGYRAEWRAALEVQGLRDLSSSTSLIATWDDHEVANNWSMEDIGEERYLAALQAYREALPQNRGDTGGIWRKLSWGTALDVFVLDCRSERMGDLYISTAQMDWLKQGLSASSARFKIICSSVPITDLTAIFGSVEAEDRWQGYSEQRDEILTHIETEEVEGVLWLAGDFHYGQIGRVSPEGQNGEDAWEVLCGPSGSDINLGAVFFVGGVSQYVDIVADYNWVRFTCDPMAGTIRVQHVNDVGDTLSDRVLEL